MSAKPALRPELAVGEALRAVARDILSDARKAIDNPENSDAVAIHDFRREIKRWRALLRLLDPFLAGEAHSLQTTARDLARALGGARDPQSALDALADLAAHGLPLSEQSLATVRGRIEDIRKAGETQVLTPDMRLQLTAGLDNAGAAVDRWPLHLLTYSDIAGRLASGYRAVQKEIPEQWSDASAEELHELRKRVVIHRYQMQIVESLWKRFAKMWIAEAQRLRERLGQHQDLQVLERLTSPHQPLARWRSRLVPAIGARKEKHVAASRRLAMRLFVEKPKAFRRRLEVMWEAG
jgi:CHAD domain-containing protein